MFSVRYYPDGNPELLVQVAAELYDTYKYPRLEFDKRTYLERVALSSSVDSMYMCFHEDTPVGGITVSPEVYDVHFNGTGRHITNFVVLQRVDSRNIVKQLLRELERGLGGEGSAWYSITHRRDFYTLSTRYRRIKWQRVSVV